MFHCSDPVEIYGSHGSQDDPLVTIRRPGIIMTSLRVAKRLTGRGDLETWSTVAKIYAPRAPISSNNHFEWYDILSALELKFKDIIAMPEILSPAQMQPPIPHQNFYETFDSIPSDAPAEPELATHDDATTQITDENEPPVIQCGMYAAEMLSGSFGALHAINLFIVGMFMRLLFVWQDVDFVADDVVWIWYYDRQGCIQSEGINFLKDLPSFFVLLYALQRLNLEVSVPNMVHLHSSSLICQFC